MDAQGTQSTGIPAGRIVLLPTVVINDKQYRGRLDALSITKALCAGFEESTEPEVCDTTSCIALLLLSMLWTHSDDGAHLHYAIDTQCCGMACSPIR